MESRKREGKLSTYRDPFPDDLVSFVGANKKPGHDERQRSCDARLDSVCVWLLDAVIFLMARDRFFRWKGMRGGDGHATGIGSFEVGGRKKLFIVHIFGVYSTTAV